jgi:maltose alpha-D-glucosyltransferase/alpha-amylase
MADEESATRVLRAMLLNRRTTGRVTADADGELRAALRAVDPDRHARLVGAEQSNSSVVLGDVIFKLFRRVDRGVNPDAEVGRHLARQGFPHIAPVLGTVDWRRTRNEVDTIGIAFGYVANQGDAWQSTLDHLSRFYETVLTEPMPPFEPKPELDLAGLDEPAGGSELVGGTCERMTLLGTRTGELHAALARSTVETFEPEPFSKLYQRSLYQGFRASLRSTLAMLQRRRTQLREELRATARIVTDGAEQLEAVIAPLRGGHLDATRIRTHGDYHLGQVLVTQTDFVVIDFEGEPARPTSERRIKRSPLVDIAGMLRSFDYAARVGLRDRVERGLLTSTSDPIANRWAEWWRAEMVAAFLRGYLAVPETRSLLPSEDDDLRLLLGAYVLDKALYELRYELANRPSWVGIPLDALRRQVQQDRRRR